MATVKEYSDDTKSLNTSQSPDAEEEPSIAYMLFEYRKTFRRFSKHSLNLYKSKLDLTEEMLVKSIKYLDEYDIDELMIIKREIDFTKELKRGIDLMQQKEKFRKLPLKRLQKYQEID